MTTRNSHKSPIAGSRRWLALFVFTVAFFARFAFATEVHYLPPDPIPVEVAAAKAAFQRGAVVAMPNAGASQFGGMLNVDVPSEVNTTEEGTSSYCIAAVRKTASGRVRVYAGASSPKGTARLASDASNKSTEQCQSAFDRWLQTPGALDDAPSPQGWTYITSYTKSATSSIGNSYTFTIDIYRANTTDPANDYFMAVQSTSATATQGYMILPGAITLTPKVGTFSLFDWGPKGLSYPESFELGGQVPGLTPYTLQWQGSGGGEYSVDTQNQVGATQAQWDWSTSGNASTVSFLDGAIFSATKKISQLAFNTSFSFTFDGSSGTEEYPENTTFSIRVVSPILSAPTDIDVTPGQTYSLPITASPYINWVIPSMPAWASLDMTSGLGTQTLELTVNQNAPPGTENVITLDSDPSYATPSVASGPLQIRVHVVGELVSSGVLLAGGVPWDSTVPTSSADIWDPTSGKIVATNSPMVAARQAHTATLLNNGMILLAGGYGADGSALDSTELFDPSTDSFSPGPTMNSAHAAHTATLLNDGSGDVLIAGGVDATGQATNVAELYDPSQNSFTKLAKMLNAREQHTATLLDTGTVLFVGGNTAPGGGTAVAEAEIYDPSSNSFSSAGTLMEPRWGHAALLLTSGIQEGQALVAGGVSATSPALFTAEIFTVNSGFSSTGDLPQDQGAAYPAAVMMPDGTPLLFGGAPNVHNVIAYDPTAGTFSTISTATLTEGRDHPTAVLVEDTSTSFDGKVMIAGGVVADSGNTDGTGLDLYDPGSQTVSSIGLMSTSRSMMTSTLFGSNSGLGTTFKHVHPQRPVSGFPR